MFNYSVNIIFAETKDINDYNTTDYIEYNILNENEFYTVNTITKKIEYFNNGNVTLFGEYGVNKGEFTDVKFFKKLQNGEFCILDNLNKLHFFDENFTYINTIESIYFNNTYYPLLNLTQMLTDIYSNVYLLDSSNNYILKANSGMKYAEVFKENVTLSNTKVTLLNSSHTFVYLQNNSLISGEQSITLQDTPSYIFSDVLDNIFIVYDDKIEKYNSNLTLIDEPKSVLKGTEYNVDLENGIIYYILNNQITKIENFASNVKDYDPPINYLENSALTLGVELFTINTQANLLKNPYSNSSIIKLNKDDIILKLSQTENLSTNFIYCIFEKDNQTYIGYIEESFLTTKEIEEQEIQVKPVRSDISYYKYPISNLENNVKLNTLSPLSTYTQTRKITINNRSFVELSLEDSFVYAQETEVLDTSKEYINVYLETNSKLNLYDKKTINLYDNVNKDTVIKVLDKEYNIKVIKTYGELTEIELILDNQIVKGYIETKYIANKNTYIIPITIILSLISLIVLLVLIIKFKKDKHK